MNLLARALLTAGRVAGRILATIAKTIGAMGGAHTHDLDNATALYKKQQDYRP